MVLVVLAAAALVVVNGLPAGAAVIGGPVTTNSSFSAPSLVASGLSGPVGLRVRATQNDVLVGEQPSGNSVIRIDLATGLKSTFADFGGGVSPRELAISPTGDVIVSGFVNSTGGTFVAQLTSTGNLVGALPPFGSFAIGATFDAVGNLYIASPGVITKFTPVGGQFVASPTVFASGFADPVELSFDTSGRLFMADVGSGTGPGPLEAVYQVVPDPGPSIPWATASDLGAAFGPFGLAVDPVSGAVFVSGVGTGQIVKITAPHVVTQVASGFVQPTGLTFDSLGNLYVAEFNGGGAGQGNVWKLAAVASVAPTTVSVAPATGTFAGTTTVSATLTSGGTAVSGASITFTLNGASVGAATTDVNGLATLSNVSLAGVNAGTYPTGVGAGFAGDATHAASTATASLTVAPATTTTVVSAPSVQYSDVSALRATVSPVSLGGQTVTGSVQFSLDGANVGSPVAIDATGVATLPQQILKAAGAYPVAASFTSTNANFASSSGSTSLTVSREDASVTPSATNPMSVKVNAPGGTAGPITLTAAIAEVPDGSPGDIANAVPVTYTLTPVGTGSPLGCTATTSGGGVGGTLTASCTFSSVAVNVYDVHIAIGGNFYQGAADSVLAVYDPSLGFTTGGGTAVHNGVLANFGFTAKYLPSGQIQGNLLYIEHRATGDVMLKSNAMGSLSIVINSPTSATGILLGKATLGGVGNYSFQVVATDNGEPGTNDAFGLRVKDPSGNVVADLTFEPLTLGGGNIQVPH